jgi:hypothetical protein
MPPLPAPAYEENRGLRSLGLDAYPSSTSDVFGATAEETSVRNPTSTLLRAYNRQADIDMVGVGAEFGAEALGREVPRMVLPAEEANERYGIPGHLTFDRDTPQSIAEELHDLKREELKRKSILSRGQGGVLETLGQFGVGLGVSALDPLNIASAFIPVVGPTRYALWAARMGTTGARAARGSIEGAVGATLLEPVIYAGARQEQADYDATDSLLNIAFGTVLGGGLHAGLGKIGDLIQQNRLAEPTLRSAIAAVNDGRPVDVAPNLRSELLRTTGIDVATRGVPEEIKLWAAQSKVVDPESGQPLRVYHGTTSAFDQFSTEALGGATGAPSAREGFFFTTDPKLANTYAKVDWTEVIYGRGGFIGNLTAAIDKALLGLPTKLVDTLESRAGRKTTSEIIDEYSPNVRPQYLDIRNPMEVDQKGAEFREKSYFDLLKEAKAKGHDGLVIRNAIDPGFTEYSIPADIFVAFKPEQIRSAFDFNATQAAADADYRKSLDAAMKADAADEREIAAIAESLARPEAKLSGANDTQSIQSDLDLITGQIDQLRKSGAIPEGELKALDEAEEMVKQSEAVAKAYEAAGVCEYMRRS